ncbi:hypothetical protein TTMY_0355 [Thermus thermophilus]|nr:hypothetical protein TTMY_0355 [Thermus thermophilus]BDB11473.1 hypothetical protein TthTMY_12120 [Thermus thermophilus]
MGLGQVLGPAVGLAQASPHLLGEEGGEEEGGEGGEVQGPLEREEEACEAHGDKPRSEPEDARYEAHGHPCYHGLGLGSGGGCGGSHSKSFV